MKQSPLIFKEGMHVQVWDSEDRYPEGRMIKGKVWNVTKNSVTVKWEDLKNPITYDSNSKDLLMVEKIRQTSLFWLFVHNVIAHPLLMFQTKWANNFHDWTAERI